MAITKCEDCSNYEGKARIEEIIYILCKQSSILLPHIEGDLPEACFLKQTTLTIKTKGQGNPKV